MPTARPSPRVWIALLFLGVALAACGPRSMKQRIAHGERRSDEATQLLNEAEQALRNLDADLAVRRLTKAKELLSHPDVDLTPESELLRSRLAEIEGRVSTVREERARRDQERARQELEATVEKQRDSVVQAMDAVNTALEALDQKDAGRAQVEAAQAAVKRVREQLQAGKALEAKSEDYEASARRTERRLEQAEARIRLAQRVLDFVSGPVSDRREAEELEKKAKKERDPDTKLTLYTDARDRLRRCGETAEKLLAETPELAQSPLEVDGRATTPKAVATGCTTKAGALQRTVAKLEKAKAAREKARARKAGKR